MRGSDFSRSTLVLFAAVAALAACGGSPSLIGAPGAAQPIVRQSLPLRPITPASQTRAALPPNLLYVALGPPQHPYIGVFNAADDSPSPSPVYTIRPQKGAGYASLAVDQSNNNLYAVEQFFGGTKLQVFASGETTARITCLFHNGITPSVTGKVLYLATLSDTVIEYALPLPAGNKCPKPLRTLTDRRAKLRGLGLYSVAANPHGAVFVTWLGPTSKLDTFAAGSKTAHPYAPLGRSCSVVEIAADAKGNLVTAVGGNREGNPCYIGVFRNGSQVPKRFDGSIRNIYTGFAIGFNDTELFAERYDPASIDVYDYDARRGSVGRRLRSFPGSVHISNIAVFSRQ
ncbi:MAG: hypothetical protein WAK16_12165 [Candidatus Cybelea sp.]